MFKKLISCLMVLSIFVLNGCSEVKSTIATSNYPITYLVERIGGELVNVKCISDSHVMQRATLVNDYDDILNDSMVYMHISGLEPYYDVYTKEINETGVNILDLGLYATIYDFKRYTYVKAGKDEYVSEGMFYESSAFNNTDMYNKDLFLWMDAISMMSMAKTITEYLCSMMPESKGYFEKNYEILKNELAILDAEYEELRTNNKEIKIATMTASFSSWQKSYGVEYYPIMLSKFGSLPNEQQIAVIEETITENDVKYIAKEANMDSDMLELLERIATDCDLEIIELHNLSSLSYDDQIAGRNYLTLMYDNLDVLESICE